MTKHQNDIIIKFMELRPCIECNNKNNQYYHCTWYGAFSDSNLHYFNSHEMKYHWHWMWLMNVVNKIESIWDDYHGYFGVFISSNGCTIQGTKFRPDKKNMKVYYNSFTGEDKIDATYKAVISFIKWYLKEIKPKNG